MRGDEERICLLYSLGVCFLNAYKSLGFHEKDLYEAFLQADIPPLGLCTSVAVPLKNAKHREQQVNDIQPTL